jgi:hypothetical protein
MRRDWLHILAAALLLHPLLANAELAGEGKWRSLFNGTNLTGWVIMSDGAFTATNNLMHLERSMGWLRTEKDYTDFVFEAEWRPLETNYNSGFFVRSGREGSPFPNSAWQVNLKENSLGSLLKGRDTVVPYKTPKVPVNEWVAFRIIAHGKRLTLEVNGAQAWEYTDLDTDRGHIGIQAEGKSFDFRNLRIRELAPPDPPPGK